MRTLFRKNIGNQSSEIRITPHGLHCLTGEKSHWIQNTPALMRIYRTVVRYSSSPGCIKIKRNLMQRWYFAGNR